MKSISFVLAVFLFAAVCALAASCNHACDDLKDVCKSCNPDSKSSCESSLDTCEIVKGPAANDCCEGILEDWEELCE